ncbi:hypothetical protein QBC45DRAFT_357300 [Copromyces sp. CBS 386.78]|nr:hypothetical protein QBC45DRAFT_357300 [Copromyces sp. CBS 386.78]
MTTEKKRKLPPRAAARSEQAAKRRQTDTPPTSTKSSTPAPAPQKGPEPEPVVEEPPKQTLPSSIGAGKPLPTVEEPQPEDLSTTDYQTLQESGVLHESFVRSRNQWMSEQIFEKYWTKPIKKRGAVIEEPNNPPKDSMVKLGQVTITVEPHVFEATMFAVKDPNPPPPKPPTDKRPILEYGPPNGVMPPPPTPKPKSLGASKSSTPTPAASDAKKPTTAEKATSQTTPQAEAKPQTPGTLAVQPTPQTQTTKPPSTAQIAASPAAPAPPTLAKPAGTSRGIESLLSPSPSLAAPQAAPRAPTTAPVVGAQPPRPVSVQATVPPNAATPATPSITSGVPPRPVTGAPAAPAAPATPRPGANGAAPAKPAAGADPIILMLAERAGEDPQLRDLMKRVAQGEASKHELERFQGIIDAITTESKRKSSIPAPPAADKLLVDGKTVQYFADEVAAILDIVLASNPKQKSSTLQPPDDSDALLVSLVKIALDDEKTKEMVRRIAHNKPQPTDAADLKAILDLAHSNIATKKKQQQRRQSTASMAGSSKQTKSAATASEANVDGDKKTEKAEKAAKEKGEKAEKASAQQALRSKGPPPPAKQPDYSAIVFEFAGGNGDRYLFPKFSLLDYQDIPSTSTSVIHGQQQQQKQQQVVASFLIIRRGSKAEYPMADPELDYYQPMTIRLFTAAPSGKHLLDNLARVVAPEEEVKRYMDDIMDTMQRSEYVLLAMRLPRPTETPVNGAGESDDKAPDGAQTGPAKGHNGKEKEKEKDKEVVMMDAPSRAEEAAAAEPKASKAARTGGVLWTATHKQIPKPEIRELPPRRNARIMLETTEDEQYQSFIQTVTRKDKEVVG